MEPGRSLSLVPPIAYTLSSPTRKDPHLALVPCFIPPAPAPQLPPPASPSIALKHVSNEPTTPHENSSSNNSSSSAAASVVSPKSPVYANVALKSPTKSHNDDVPKVHTPSSPSIVTLKKTTQTAMPTPPAAPQFATPHLKPSPGAVTTSTSNNPPSASASPAFANVALKTTGASLTSSTTNSLEASTSQPASKDKEPPAYAKIALKSAGTSAAASGSAPPAYAKVALKSAGGNGGDDSVWRSSTDKPSAPAYANLALKKTTGTTAANAATSTGSSNATGSAAPAYAGVALKSTGFVPTETNDGVPGLPGGF